MKRYKPNDNWPCSTCKKLHAFGAWVVAHWDESLTHTCDCGAEHEVHRGTVTVLQHGQSPDKPKRVRKGVTKGVSL